MSNLTIDELFTPAPSGVIPQQPSATPSDDTFLAQILATATRIGLSATTWQPGDPSRTILSILAVTEANRDGLVSLFNQGGFLDWAANGTVTFQQANGVIVTEFVTPDPSIPSQNPNGAPGWLDVLAFEVYNVLRESATFANGLLSIVNTTASTFNYAAGTFHVVNELTSITPPPTYSNVAALTVTPSAHTTVSSIVVVSTLLTITLVSGAGLTVGPLVFFQGTGLSIDGTFQSLLSVAGNVVTVNLQAPPTGTFTSGGQLYVPQTAEFQADVIGPGSSAVAGAITGLVTTQLGVEVSNALSFIGDNWESNASVVLRCRARLAALSPSGPRGAYVFFALTASQVLDQLDIQVPAASGGTVQVELTAPIVQAIVQTDTFTGRVIVTIANDAGSTNGCQSDQVTAATATTPIAITVNTNHNLVTGQFVYVAGIEGLVGANGFWQVTVTGPLAFTLNGSVGTGVYTSGSGTVEGGDLGLTDLVIQQNVPQDDNTAFTQWAGTTGVTVVSTVYVPSADVATYKANLASAMAAYFKTIPIGGVTNVEANNIVPIGAVIGILYSAGVVAAGTASVVSSVNGTTLNGSPTDLSVTPTSKCILTGGIAGIAVIGT